MLFLRLAVSPVLPVPWSPNSLPLSHAIDLMPMSFCCCSFEFPRRKCLFYEVFKPQFLSERGGRHTAFIGGSGAARA